MSLSTNINTKFYDFVVPDYQDDVVNIKLADEQEFLDWFHVASKHANWVINQTYPIESNVQFIGVKLAKPVPVQTTIYFCDHAGKPQKNYKAIANPTPPEAKRVKYKKSIKIGCTARIHKYLLSDSSINVKYNWKHPDHDPFNIREITSSRLPAELKKWIEEHVENKMDWKSIKDLLRLDEAQLVHLEQNPHTAAIPASLLINYQHVKNIINAYIMKKSRKHAQDGESVKVWLNDLEVAGAKTLFKLFIGGPFLLSWVSSWQVNFLESSEECPVTNKGLPVCFCVTDHETIPTLAKWLYWLKENFNLNVKRIMIDCSATEIAAIREVFGDVDILLCHWHIKRAWESHVKKDITVKGATHESNRLRDKVRVHLNTMMHASSVDSFDSSYESFKNEFEGFDVFMKYFDKLWLPRKELWCKAWRPSATFHTNNLVESYHNQL